MELTLQLWQSIANRFELEKNVARITKVISKGDAIDIFAFPESALWGPIEEGHSYPSQNEVDGAILRIQEQCEKFRKNAIVGTPYPLDDGVENRAYLLGGNEPQYYTKVHVHWSEDFKPGKNFPVFKCNGINTGMLICFDIAFPEAARILTLKDIQMLFIIAATPDTFHPRYNQGRAKGLAILNQIWVIYLNRCDAGFNGHSIVVNPEGDPVSKFNSKTEMQIVTLNIDEVSNWRKKEPALRFRRPELYKELLRKK